VRWKLSQLWSIPYTDSYWNTLTSLQWYAFAEHLALDKKQKEEFLRDLSEYAMAFHNYEAVQAVRDSRDEELIQQEINEEEIFAQQVEKLFGRKLGLDKEDTSPQEDTIRVVKKNGE